MLQEEEEESCLRDVREWFGLSSTPLFRVAVNKVIIIVKGD